LLILKMRNIRKENYREHISLFKAGT